MKMVHILMMSMLLKQMEVVKSFGIRLLMKHFHTYPMADHIIQTCKLKKEFLTSTIILEGFTSVC